MISFFLSVQALIFRVVAETRVVKLNLCASPLVCRLAFNDLQKHTRASRYLRPHRSWHASAPTEEWSGMHGAVPTLRCQAELKTRRTHQERPRRWRRESGDRPDPDLTLFSTMVFGGTA
jgi:hypothetical protein